MKNLRCNTLWLTFLFLLIEGQITVISGQDISDSIRFEYNTSDFGTILIGDYDSDNDLDAFLVSGFREVVQNIMIENKSESFELKSLEIGDVFGEGKGQAWIDYDNDNDLDLIISGTTTEGFPATSLYSNDGLGKYTEIFAGLENVAESACATGDLDNDGDQDLILCGLKQNGNAITRLYFNQGEGIFLESEYEFEGLSGGAVIICDLDNDADNDIVINGYNSSRQQKTILIQNDRGNKYSIYDGLLTGIGWGSWKAIDLNDDGMLDLLGTNGATNRLAVAIQQNELQFEVSEFQSPGSNNNRLDVTDLDQDGNLEVLLSSGFIQEIQVKSISDIVISITDTLDRANPPGDVRLINWDSGESIDVLLSGGKEGGALLYSKFIEYEMPPAPINLSSTVSERDSHLSWKLPSSPEADQGNLSYNLRIGTTPGGSEILSPLSDSSGFRKLMQMGNCGLNTFWDMDNLSPGTYYWSVQTINQKMTGSAFSAEDSFIIDGYYTLISAFQRDSLAGQFNYMKAADLDKDGDTDFLCIYKHRGGLLRNSGDTSYVFENVIPFIDSCLLIDAHISDFNNDGFPDFALSQIPMPGSLQKDTLFTLIENQNGQDFVKVNFDLGSIFTRKIHCLDFDSDGDKDLSLLGIGKDGDLRIEVYKNQGNKVFTLEQSMALPGMEFMHSRANDLNSDGKTDLLVIGKTFNQFFELGQDGWYESTNPAISDIKGNVEVCDYNNDGYLDLMEYGSQDERVFNFQVYTSNNAMSYDRHDFGIPGVNINGMARWGDFDMDKQADILLLENEYVSEISALTIYTGRDSVFEESILSLDGAISLDSITSGRIMVLDDLDGDMDLDMVISGETETNVYTGYLFQDTPSAVTIPAPENLRHSLNGQSIFLKWDSIPGNEYYFNVRVGTEPDMNDVVSSLSDPISGRMYIPGIGNAECCTFFSLESLNEGEYFWSVQAISKNKAGGPWSAPNSFAVGSLILDFNVTGVCSGDSVSFNCQSNDALTNWQWDFGDGSTSDLENPEHVYTEPGEYEVSLTSAYNGNLFTHREWISIKRGVDVNFDFQEVELGRDVPFSNRSSNPDIEITDWVWDFGDGSIFSGFDPVSHYYEFAQSYNVTLTASAANGCTGEIQKDIKMCEDLPEVPEILVGSPNVWYLACSSNTKVEVYRWYYNGVHVKEADDQAVYFPGDKMGDYYVRISIIGDCFVQSETVTIGTPTGIPNHEMPGKLSIFPNPSRGEFIVNYDSPSIDDFEIEIFSVQGFSVYQKQFKQIKNLSDYRIDLNPIEPGIYIVKYQQAGTVTSRKIVIQK